MKHNKQDFQITYIKEGCYQISMRTRFLFFFYNWDTITYQEAEHTDDKPLEFESFNAATDFIETIAK